MTDEPADAGRDRYFALQRLARSQGRDTQELLTLYALEGLLARLAVSMYGDRFVLKGGMLLAAFGQRRPTRDLDVHAETPPADLDTVRDAITEIAAVSLDDGLRFDTDDVTAEVIRDEDAYSGVRVSVDVALHTARLTIKVDVNVGDPIWPSPQLVSVPRLLDDEPLQLRGYPLHMALAEKLVTAVDRGTANTRWRDFTDIYLLTRQHQVAGSDLVEAIRRVAAHRAVQLAPLSETLGGYAELAQPKWVAWRDRHELSDRLPVAFADVLDEVIAFADPAIAGDVTDATWNPNARAWSS